MENAQISDWRVMVTISWECMESHKPLILNCDQVWENNHPTWEQVDKTLSELTEEDLSSTDEYITSSWQSKS